MWRWRIDACYEDKQPGKAEYSWWGFLASDDAEDYSWRGFLAGNEVRARHFRSVETTIESGNSPILFSQPLLAKIPLA